MESEENERCPWCNGSGLVPLGGYPDVNGYEREGSCPCDDGTAAGAFHSLKRQLDAAKQFREQAIQDIEALPSMRLVNMDNREVISRDEAIRIVRGVT